MSFIYNCSIWLTSARINTYKYGGPALTGLGTIGCVLNVVVFTRKQLRKNPCSIYLITYNVGGFLFIYIPMLIATLTNGYYMDFLSNSLALCRLNYYTLLLLDVLNPCYLILASIDRAFITSHLARTRQRSTRRLAYSSILIVTVFWLLFHIHALILNNLFELVPGTKLCYFQPGLQTEFVTYYLLIVKDILIPLVMIVLAVWTVKNVRYINRVHSAPIIPTFRINTFRNMRINRSRDRQLLQILLAEIIIYIIFNIMTPFVLIYEEISLGQPQNLITVELQTFLQSIGDFSSYIPSCIGFYTNLVISKTFRREVKKIFMCK